MKDRQSIENQLHKKLTEDPMFNSMLPNDFSNEYDLIVSGVLDSLGLSDKV